MCRANILQIFIDLFDYVVFKFQLTAQTVNQTDNQLTLTMMNGRNCQRKVAGCVPHDVGDPGQ